MRGLGLEVFGLLGGTLALDSCAARAYHTLEAHTNVHDLGKDDAVQALAVALLVASLWCRARHPAASLAASQWPRAAADSRLHWPSALDLTVISRARFKRWVATRRHFLRRVRVIALLAALRETASRKEGASLP